MHVKYIPNGRNTFLNGLGKSKKKSRKDILFEQLAAELEAAFAKAESPEATISDIENAEKLQKQYQAAVAAYEAGARKKAKGLIPRLIKLQEKKIKVFAKLKIPTFKTHAKHAERKERAAQIKIEFMKLQGEKKTPERDAKLKALSAEIADIAKKEKQYMKTGSIVAAIISVVIGIFTFGGGSAALQGAFQALKQGAVQIAKSILISAVGAALKKGASKKDADKALEVANDLEKYPPDPSLTTFDAMISDSQRKKNLALQQKTAWIIPAGIVTALTLFS